MAVLMIDTGREMEGNMKHYEDTLNNDQKKVFRRVMYNAKSLCDNNNCAEVMAKIMQMAHDIKLFDLQHKNGFDYQAN